MDIDQVGRLLHTLKHLKFIQVYHQIKYRLIKPKRVGIKWSGSFIDIKLTPFPQKKKCFTVHDGKWRFDFLNLSHSFDLKEVDWSFVENGMLWAYNLNYFDYLCQTDMTKEQGLELLSCFYSTPHKKKSIILHPYPVSLRIINISKFISRYNVKEEWLYHELVTDLKFLNGRLEYHLLGNHLLENAFALYVGGVITGQNEFIQNGKNLLNKEMKEQILNDGMHYERSPMYHLIILERVIDTLNFSEAYNDNLKLLLKSYAIKMTSFARNWEELIRFPMIQDSAYDIALPVNVLNAYSKSLLGKEYPSLPSEMKESGYRILRSGEFYLFANVGCIAPSYQPAHAHSDELTFELFYNDLPYIVDMGISTYQKNEQRKLERSSSSHNCISLNDENLSDIWSGFRVGKRAKVSSKSNKNNINAICKNKKIEISREFCLSNRGIKLIDNIKLNSTGMAFGYLHIHPDYELESIDKSTFKVANIIISINSDKDGIRIDDFDYCAGYNKRVPSKKIVYSLKSSANVEFRKA